MKYSLFIALVIILLASSCEAPLGGDIMGRIKSYYFKPFENSVNLGQPIKDHKFTYVLMRSSFRPPENTDKTFPTDENYANTWKRGELTETGWKLAQMLGRSLANTGYAGLMMRSWVESVKPVRMSGLNKPYVKIAARAFQEGYLENYKDKFPTMPFHVTKFDKTELFEKNDLCPAYATLVDTVQKEQEKEFLTDPGNQEFLEELRRNIGVTDPNNEWYIDSLKKVYWLYEILDLEKSSKDRNPKWMNENIQAKLDKFVREYFKESIHGDIKMTKYLIGPLLNQILEKDKDGYTRLHTHITDEMTFAAFKSVMFNKPAAPVQFGEMLLLDVDTNGNIEVRNSLPLSSKLFRINVAFKTLDDYKNKFSNYLLPETSWDSACNNPIDNEGSSSSSTAGNPVGTV